MTTSTNSMFSLGRRHLAIMILGALLFSSDVALAQSNTKAANSSGSRTAVIEIAETSKSGSKNVARLMVSLTEGVPSELRAPLAGSNYELRVRTESGTTSVELKGTVVQRNAKASGSSRMFLHLSARAKTPRRQRVILGRVESPDGSSYQVSVTLQ